ncbi:MAG: DNA internalization-related competence protein ComEC/Rec2 [Candidatus Aminicenantes bacterium]|nr:DNA internalization-related competence protein ComEC/Rec2 [Candidatus Aminicenantes bacterium]
MAFPFLFVVLSFAAGILFSSLLSLPLVWLAVLLLFNLIIAWLSLTAFRRNKSAFIFLLTSTFFLGAAWHSQAAKQYQNNPLRHFKSDSYVDIMGVICKSPSFSMDRIYLYLKTKEISTQNKTEQIKGNLRVSIPNNKNSDIIEKLLVRDKVKVSAKISSRHGFRNFGLPQSSRYLRFRRIHQTAFCKSPLLVEKQSPGSDFSLLRIISKVRRKIQKNIETFFPGETQSGVSSSGAIMEALLLGERGRMTESFSRSLQESGLYHLFAISGAHIAIISFLLFSLLKMVHVPSRTSYLVLMVILILYALLVEGRPSIIRATLMTLIFLTGKLIWKDTNLFNTLSLSAFVLLVINPFHLFSLGFQMTFAATLSIILFFPVIIKYLPSFPLKISEILALSFTAQLGILPITAFSFNRIALAPLVLNLAALPLISLIMAAGYVFLFFAFLAPGIAHFSVTLLELLIQALVHVSRFASSMNFLCLRVPTPHPAIVMGYYVSLLAFLVPKKIKKQKLLTCLVFSVFLFIIIIYPFSSPCPNLKITFIDVGNGDSILVEFPGTKKMLVDGGGSAYGSFDIGERVVSPFLWKKGIKKIDYLVLTHAHPDHLYGLFSVVENFKIKEFWEAMSPRDNKAYQAFKKRLHPRTRRKKLFQGHTLKTGRVLIRILHPEKPKDPPLSAHNNQSLVLMIQFRNTSFLLSGDAELEAEQSIVSLGQNVDCQVLKSPHHGSSSSSSQEFLEAVDPEIVVVSVGANNLYGLPSDQVMLKYKDIGAQVFRTDLHGAVEIVSDGQHLSTKTAVREKSETH